MADGNVTTGHIGNLAFVLQKALGRRVVVHRTENKLRLPGRPFANKTEIRYSLGIAGSHPPVFFGMTANEVKARMTMLVDLLQSGVVSAAPLDRTAAEGANQSSSASVRPETDVRREGASPQGSGSGEQQSGGDDDRY